MSDNDEIKIDLTGKLPDLVEKQVEKLRKAGSARNTNAVSAWGTKKGGVDIARYHYCHASMDKSYHQAVAAADINVLLSQYQTPVVNEGKIKDYFEWLFNYSPFAECFVSKSASKTIKDKVVVLNPDVPYNLAGGAMIASRLGTERYTPGYRIPARLLLWHDLVSKGVHPNLAFTLSHFGGAVEINGEDLKIDGVKSWNWATSACGHEALNTGTTPCQKLPEDGGGYVQVDSGYGAYPKLDFIHGTFFNGSPLGAAKETFRSKGNRIASTYAWVGKDFKTLIKKFPSVNDMVLKELMAQVKGEKASNNPFAKAKPIVANSTTFSYNQMVEVISGMKADLMKIVENKDYIRV